MYQLLDGRRFNPLESGQVRKVISLLAQALRLRGCANRRVVYMSQRDEQGLNHSEGCLPTVGCSFPICRRILQLPSLLPYPQPGEALERRGTGTAPTYVRAVGADCRQDAVPKVSTLRAFSVARMTVRVVPKR